MGLVAYRALDVFAYGLKLEQSVARLNQTLPMHLSHRQQLRLAYRGCQQKMTRWEMRRLVRRYRKITNILAVYDIIAAYGSVGLFAAFGLIIFLTKSADKAEAAKYTFTAATIAIALPISYFSYLVESFKLQADRFFWKPANLQSRAENTAP